MRNERRVKMDYKKGQAALVNDIVEIPDNAIAVKQCLIFTGSFNDPTTRLVDGVTYLVPVEEE